MMAHNVLILLILIFKFQSPEINVEFNLPNWFCGSDIFKKQKQEVFDVKGGPLLYL